MITCNKPIRCWDLMVRPCVRPEGHTKGFCNPFSADNPFDPDPPKQEKRKAEESAVVSLYSDVLKAAGIQVG